MDVFYRKYRPQNVAELDNEPARKQITDILSSGRLPHAFLFIGSKGTGKTSAARIIAKAVNCENRGIDKNGKKSFEPCNKCEACLSITEGRNMDVLEIDAASNRGIDEIRDLREKIKLSPSSLKFKVYIIDEVHMLTNEAFNALLKTLEEPPSHAIFILCTTEKQKLPETIISRCTVVDFKRAKKDDLISSLKKVVVGEGYEVSSEVLAIIAKMAEGSFRDGQKILDQLSLGGDFSKEALEKLYSISSFSEVFYFVNLLFEKRTKEAVIYVNRIVEDGGNVEEFLDQILDFLRMILIVKAGAGEELVSTNVTDGSYAKILEMSSKIGNIEIIRVINLFSKARRELKDAFIQQLPIELAIAEFGGSDGGETEGIQETHLIPSEIKVQAKGVKELEVVEVVETETVVIETKTEKVAADDGVREEAEVVFEKIEAAWKDVLKIIKTQNHSVEALLRAARPKETFGKTVVLEVFYKFHKDKIDKEPARGMVERVLSEIFGTPLRIKCILGEKPKSAKESVDNIDEVKNNDAELVKVAEEIFLQG